MTFILQIKPALRVKYISQDYRTQLWYEPRQSASRAYSYDRYVILSLEILKWSIFLPPKAFFGFSIRKYSNLSDNILKVKFLYKLWIYFPFITEALDSFCIIGEVKSLSRVWLFVTPWTVAYQGPLSVGFFRQEYWSELPFSSPGDFPNPGIKPRSPELQEDALTSEPPGKISLDLLEETHS